MNTVPECFYRTSIKGLIIDDDGKFLLCKESSGVRELPGGGLDHGENSYDCLVREMDEEMGLEVLSMESQPSYFFTFESPTKKTPRANVIYKITTRDYNFTPSDECVEVGFFTPEEALQENILPNVRKMIDIMMQ